MAANAQANQPATLPETGFIRIGQVTRFTSYSRSSIYRLLDAGLFPRPVKLAGGRTNAWRVEEIRAWIDAQQPEGVAA